MLVKVANKDTESVRLGADQAIAAIALANFTGR
jgi:hypothetical protein